jgi:hypothetical protein
MKNIESWFNELIKTNPEKQILIEKIILGIESQGFDDFELKKWIEQEIKKINKSIEKDFKKSDDT